MNEFEQQYQNELQNQEKKTNRWALWAVFVTVGVMTFIGLLVLLRFFKVDVLVYTAAYGVTVLLCVPLLLLYLKEDLQKPWIKYFVLATVCVITAVICTALSYHAALVVVLPLLLAVQYRSEQVLWVTFGMDVAALVVSLIAGFYCGICDLNILYAGNYTYSWYMKQMADGTLEHMLTRYPAFEIVLYGVIPRTIILLLFTLLLRHMIVTTANDAKKIAELTYRKGIDSFTGLYNKNKYEEMMAHHYLLVDRVLVIFWDINNLKKINDRMGHAMGDKLITTLSDILRRQKTGTAKIYRIGGDEFVMIVENPSEGDAERIVAKVEAELKRCREEGGLLVSSAVGWAEGSGLDILKVVSKADANMYDDKRRQKMGRDAMDDILHCE